MARVRGADMSNKVAAYMSLLSNKIKQAEDDIRPVWFDVTYGDLSWAIREEQGIRRLMLGDRPLADSKFEMREKYWKDALSLRDLALQMADERFNDAGLDLDEIDETGDTSPWCSGCGARFSRQCNCGPRAEND